MSGSFHTHIYCNFKHHNTPVLIVGYFIQFVHTVFIHSTFSKAYMHKVSMEYTRIVNGNFTNADLSYSNWRYAYCERCIFDQANLTNADFFGATFIDSDLRNSVITKTQLIQAASLERSILPNETVLN